MFLPHTILQMKKVKLRGVKQLAQGYTADKEQGQDLEDSFHSQFLGSHVRSHVSAAFNVVKKINEIFNVKVPILTSYFINSQVIFSSAPFRNRQNNKLSPLSSSP